jgi:hypothetical protein
MQQFAAVRGLEWRSIMINADPFARIQDLFHFTDRSNFPSIRKLDGLYCTAKLKERDEEFCAGGDEDSLSLDGQCGMDQYVHLCWDFNHPMAFRIKQRKPDANLFYLRIDRTILYEPGVMFVTGVGYANNAETMTLAEAVERDLIDYTALYTRTDWSDPVAQAKRRAAELCEILVPAFVPMTFVRNMPNG